ncbi:ABC transporter ATP-binding protein [Metabacillus fastidiosus]|uniref:ABC transporter ATP-binding protein n=1 Tax=Metabacillus fastidiosus TaxID=1458 RepID=UPI003D2C60F1
MPLNTYDNQQAGEAPFISLKDMQMEYQSGSKTLRVLENIDLDVNTGDFICVLGPSGCGKTSLLRIIAGYENATSGEVKIDGKKHKGPNADIGVVFQQANLFPWLSVEKNIEFGLKMKKLPKSERKRIIDHHINMVGLTEFSSLLPHELSGGMKQRAAIARSLATEPKVILMDEPFAALDSITRQSIQEQLRKLWKQTNKTIFFITHDVDEAIFLANRIITINGSPGTITLDIENTLADKIEEASDYRDLKGYNELRHLLINTLKNREAPLSQNLIKAKIAAAK